MSEELGKIEKPSVEEFKNGRKLYFVPLIYCGKEAPEEYVEMVDRYWEQVEDQLGNLEQKLGMIHRIFHELVTVGGDEGMESIKELDGRCYEITRQRCERGAQIEAVEEGGLLAELMDWSRCLSVGLQSAKVFGIVYDAYREASKNRNEHITKQIAESLKEDEIGIIYMREGHQVQFPTGVDVFYVAPPALDEITRWVRAREDKQTEEVKQD